MIGRPLVYPIQFDQTAIDLSGTTMTTSLVQKLKEIRDNNFKKATKKIKKRQAKYKRDYDKRMNVKPFKMKIGEKVQYKRYKSKNTLSKNELTMWCPVRSYHTILAVDIKRKRVFLQDREGKKLKHTQSFDNLRKFKGKL